MTSKASDSDDEYQDAKEFCEEQIKNEPGNQNTCDEIESSFEQINLDSSKNQNSVPTESEETREKMPTTEEADEEKSTCQTTTLAEDEEALRELEKHMTEEELRANQEKAATLKLKGNEFFNSNEITAAIDVYTEALGICPTNCPKDRAVLYGNRAAAQIKIDSQKSAIEDCSKAIELWPEYVRAIMRRAKLFESQDQLDEALADYKRAYELDPGLREAHNALIRLPPIINERNERLKVEMMSKLKDLGNMVLKPFGLSTSNFQMQQDPTTGSYSINFSQNPQ